MKPAVRRRLFAWVALAPPVLWSANTQLGEMLPAWQCRTQASALAVTSGVALLVTLLAAALTARSYRRRDALPSARGTSAFVARLSSLLALVFAFALALQTLASMALTGCER